MSWKDEFENKYGFYRMFSTTINEAVVDMTWDKFLSVLEEQRKETEQRVAKEIFDAVEGCSVKYREAEMRTLREKYKGVE
jgi:hypothetical protein